MYVNLMSEPLQSNPRRRLTRAESRERTRELVLKAAAGVFRRRGYHGSSVEEVAERAGFSRGAVYSNFSNKDDLFLAVYDREVERRTTRLLEAVGGGSEDLADRIGAGADVYSVLLGEDPAWSALVIEFVAHASRYPPLRRELAGRSLKLRARIAEGLDALAEQLGLRWPIDVEQAALAAMTINAGASLERLLHDDPRSTAVYRLVATVFARGLQTLPEDDPVFAETRSMRRTR
jgi:AcrR family transcriptional regulator